MRRSRSTASALVAVAVAAVGWLAWQELWARGGDRPLAWRDLTGRALGEPSRSQLAVFGGDAAIRTALGSSATVPPIDFGRREAVLVAAGPRSSTAFALDVVRVTEERRRIVVTIRERAPTLARPGTAALVFPFRLITIERTGKPVELAWDGRP
ncbi:MAG: hypothetical protein MSC30_12945 [Gaiellaceae bacterium MAG52_C11]|nr:hypothetical protein [Candidatus Gaiellasilicea maunaloa]